MTDPPYNVDYEGEAGKIDNDNMANEDFRKFLAAVLRNASNVMVKGASFFIWFADKMAYWVHGAIVDTDWVVRQMPIWKKNSLVLGRSHFQYIHEPCFYGWLDGATSTFTGDRSQVTVWEFDRPTHNALHPTMKPVPLFAYLIDLTSRQDGNEGRGDNVLDLFGGSGTTLIACEQLGRNAFLMELDPRYVDVIVKRYIQLKESDEDCYLIRNGEKLPIPDQLKESLN